MTENIKNLIKKEWEEILRDIRKEDDDITKDSIDYMDRLNELHAKGIVNEDEYKEKKGSYFRFFMNEKGRLEEKKKRSLYEIKRAAYENWDVRID